MIAFSSPQILRSRVHQLSEARNHSGVAEFGGWRGKRTFETEQLQQLGGNGAKPRIYVLCTYGGGPRANVRSPVGKRQGDTCCTAGLERADTRESEDLGQKMNRTLPEE